jgi:hypothetical protein
MGDRTAVSLTIYKIGQRGGSRKLREDIASLLREYGLTREFSDSPEALAENLVGEPWSDYEMSLGAMSEVVNNLMGMPVWFRAQEDAYSPWIGELWMYTPKLGLFHSACSDEGMPLFTDDEVRRIVAMRLSSQDPDGVLMERRLGKPWFDELALIAAQEGSR